MAKCESFLRPVSRKISVYVEHQPQVQLEEMVVQVLISPGTWALVKHSTIPKQCVWLNSYDNSNAFLTWYYLHYDINHYPGRWWSGGCVHGDRLALILGTRKYLLNIGITWDIEAKDHLFAQVGPNQGLNGEGKGWSQPWAAGKEGKG